MTFKSQALRFTLLASAVCALQSAHAESALTINVVQGDKTYVATFTSFVNLVDTFNSDAALKAKFPGFSTSQASTTTIDYLGIPIVITTDSGGKSGALTITAAEFTKAYSGNLDREATLKQIKTDIEGQYSKIQSSLASTTSNSTIAGNPSSTQSQLVSTQFDSGYTAMASQIASPTDVQTSSSSSSSTGATGSSSSSSGSQGGLNLAGLGLRFGQFSQGNLKSRSTTLPLSYSWRFEGDQRRHVTVFMPLTAGQVDDSKVFNGQLGVSVGIPITPRWALTPSVGVGASGSLDLAQASKLVSASLTSSYVVPLDGKQAVAIGNMVGYYKTLKIKIDDYEIDPKISNTIFRNGVMYSMPLPGASDKLSLEFSLINTLFTGTDLYSNSTNEVGVTIGTSKSVQGKLASLLRAGVSYIQSRGANGFSVNVGYWF